MNPLGRQWPGRADSSAQEMEVLQTDVMRFMALLGFCLMAIFALVQSLPGGQPNESSPERSRAGRNKQLEQRAASLQDDLAALKQALAATHRQERQSHARLKRTAALAQTAESTLKRRQQRNAALAGEIEAHRRTLMGLERRLTRQRERLAASGAEPEAKPRATSRPKPKAEPAATDSPAQGSPAQGSPAQGSPAQDSPAQGSPAQGSPAQDAPRPGAADAAPQQTGRPGAGFVLRFASEQAFATLVDQDKVQFYAIKNDRAWRLNPGRRSPDFTRAGMPKRFYEMELDTVPAAYPKALAKTITTAERSGITWGVALPPAIRARIEHLTGQYRGGELVIGGDGAVNRLDGDSS